MRIAVVNAPPRDAEILRQSIDRVPEHHVIWTAQSDGCALALCAKDRPDLILLDMAHGTDGVEVTRRIMAAAPCAILIVTDSVYRNAARVFDAMGQGALDAVDMPASGSGEDAAALLSRLATIARLVGETSAPGTAPVDGRSALHGQTLIAIGASTGGPAAVAEVLRGLPSDLPAAIVVIQHVDAQFAAAMADWLSEQSAIPVSVAEEGARLTHGRALLAGTVDHLALKSAERLGYTPEPCRCVYRPSVDVFFDSVSRLWHGDVVGVLLTGMGADGAIGLKGLRNRGHHTIAQDQGSCAVYGMPRAAAGLNAAVEILPVRRIASRLIAVVAGLRHVERAPRDVSPAAARG